MITRAPVFKPAEPSCSMIPAEAFGGTDS